MHALSLCSFCEQCNHSSEILQMSRVITRCAFEVLTTPECVTDSLPLTAKTFPLRSCLNLPISFNQVEKSFWQHDRGGHNASLISRLSPRHNFHPSHRHEDEASGQSAIMPVCRFTWCCDKWKSWRQDSRSMGHPFCPPFVPMPKNFLT